jgi:hypothetical protein
MASKMLVLFQIFLILVFIAGIYVIIEFYAKKKREGIEMNIECSNLLIKKGETVLLYNTEKPRQEGMNPIVFANLDDYVQYLDMQRSSGQKCPVLFLKEESSPENPEVTNYSITVPPSAADLFEHQVTSHPVTEIMVPDVPVLEPPPMHESMRIGHDTVSSTVHPQIPTSAMMHHMKPFNEPEDKEFVYTTTGFNHSNKLSKDFGEFALSGNAAFTKAPKEGMTYAVDASRESKIYNVNNYPGFDPYNQGQGIYTNIDAVHDSTKTADELSDNPMDENWGGVMYTEEKVKSGKYDDYNIFRPSLVQPKFSYGENVSLNGSPQDILEPQPETAADRRTKPERGQAVQPPVPQESVQNNA